MDPFGRIRVQRREEDQQLVSILANYLESVLGSRRLAQSVIVVHYMGLAVNFYLHLTAKNHDRFINQWYWCAAERRRRAQRS